MNDPNTAFHSQDVFRGVSNGHLRVEDTIGLASCPTCERPFTADDKAARAKAEAHERARADQWRQLQEEARKEGMEAAQAASKELIEALVADNARLKDDFETAVSEQTEARVAAERLQMEVWRQGQMTICFMVIRYQGDNSVANPKDVDRRINLQTLICCK